MDGRYHGDGQSIVGLLLNRIILTRVGDECASTSQVQVQSNSFLCTCDYFRSSVDAQPETCSWTRVFVYSTLNYDSVLLNVREFSYV